MVAIYPQPVELNLFQFFWKELKLIGARVYEPDDYEKAISLMASGELPLDRMITDVKPLGEIQRAFETLESNPAGMKTLLACGSEI
jgi:threonine dehydrogenase-like Zn-dependent dehydrogenase